MIKTDICIVGSGPSGAMTALRLAKEGVPFVIVDKAVFPKDKICGDGLSAKVPLILRRISEDLFERFLEKCKPVGSTGVRVIAPGELLLDIPFSAADNTDIRTANGYTVKREVFDAFLADEVAQLAGKNMLTNTAVKAVHRTEYGYIIETDQVEIQAKLLIDATGTNSRFTHDYHKPKSKPNRTALSVRAYYEGVSNCHERNFVEMHFIDGITPGYFWIFPMPDGQANVGVYLRKDLVRKDQIILTKLLDKYIQSHPTIAPRFKDATQLGKVKAWSLPLGKPKFRISGDHYMLVGDAAHLVDPLSGEGVGNAFYSGYYAAEQAVECLKNERFDGRYMRAYDKRIARTMNYEFAVSHGVLWLLRFPRLIKWLAKKALANKNLPDVLSASFKDDDYRKKLRNPFFLIKVLFDL